MRSASTGQPFMSTGLGGCRVTWPGSWSLRWWCGCSLSAKDLYRSARGFAQAALRAHHARDYRRVTMDDDGRNLA
jgi:hypothetical protein